jgi:hypothetical protein
MHIAPYFRIMVLRMCLFCWIGLDRLGWGNPIQHLFHCQVDRSVHTREYSFEIPDELVWQNLLDGAVLIGRVSTWADVSGLWSPPFFPPVIQSLNPSKLGDRRERRVKLTFGPWQQVAKFQTLHRKFYKFKIHYMLKKSWTNFVTFE